MICENHAFFEKADSFLKSITPNTHILAAIDITNFRLFNKFYGRDDGDRLLIYILDCIRESEHTYNGISGYLGGDNFCMILPDNPDIISELEEKILTYISQYQNTIGFYPVFGLYPIAVPEEPAAAMYDHATTTILHAIGKLSKRICYYDAEKFENDFKLLSEIHTALAQEEFTFYAQPQCDIATGKIVGAESLVRWNHSTKGLISPGVFIPLLEKSGLIYELDRYVWKKVCQWLRAWIDRGYRPVPLSINVSRIDISSMDVPACLIELIQMYNLTPKLLKIEITESAYAENSDEIINVIQKLRDFGFLVMMDDFGSGYSSLNMLKTVSVDVLKLDMRFLEIGDNNEKMGIGILESVVNMAKTMGLPIIVEGVETKKQEQYLSKMGCRYIQGYYYYKPLPISEFEELIADERKLDFNGLICRQVEKMHVREFLEDNLFDDTMLNNMLGAIAFYEVYENQIEIVRANEQYYLLTGISTQNSEDSHLKMWSHVRDDDNLKLLSIFEKSYKNPLNGAFGNIHYVRTDGKILWIYLRAYFLQEADGHKLFYGSLVDMTENHEKNKNVLLPEQDAYQISEKQYFNMMKHFGNMPFCYGIAKIDLDNDNQPKDFNIVYINHEMQNLCDGNIERLRSLVDELFPDRTKLLRITYKAAYQGGTENYYSYSPISNRYLQLTFYQYVYGYTGCILRDVTHAHLYEDALNSILHSYRYVYIVHLQDNYCRMIHPDEDNILERGNYEEMINRHFRTGMIVTDKEINIRRFLSLDNLREQLMTKDSIECRYQRIVSDAKEAEWCLTNFIVSERDADQMPKIAIMTISSIQTLMNEKEQNRRQQMAEILTTMSEGFFIYTADNGEKILYANPKACQIFGCSTMDEFMKLTGGSFRTLVHPGDINRVEWEINKQISLTDNNMDYIKYRIIRKDGKVRWIDDCGHLENALPGTGHDLFYVFISDITDEITKKEKEKLLHTNRYY